ncbi:HAD family hydrolase [Desulfovibrio sp. OttesenSCG-928-A18]|nr:HAD family hydrolase [Desulfovibrio sp. OttesenSCG-928-A18]
MKKGAQKLFRNRGARPSPAPYRAAAERTDLAGLASADSGAEPAARPAGARPRAKQGRPSRKGEKNGTQVKGLKGLVFDVDGVLFDSRRSNMEYYNLIRRAVQMPPLSYDEEDFCQMATVHECLAFIIPPEHMEAAEEACLTINYQKQILPLLSLEPGLLEALHWLRQWNVRLGVFTNRTESVHDLLRYFGLEEFFSPVKCAAYCPPKPNPGGLLQILDEWAFEPGQIAFIGDSKVDELAAKNAGVPFWSFRNESLRASLHLDDFFRMISWLTPLVEGSQ